MKNANRTDTAMENARTRAMSRSLNLTPLARKIVSHLIKAGSLSAREASNDYGITSSSLTRRLTDIEQAGIAIKREHKNHPVHGRKYTRYSLAPVYIV